MITIKTRTFSNVCAEFDSCVILLEHQYSEETDTYTPKFALYNIANGFEQNVIIDRINNYHIYNQLYHNGMLCCLAHDINNSIVSIIELSYNCNGLSISEHKLSGIYQKDYTLENTRIIPNSLGDYFVQLNDEYQYFSNQLKRNVEVDEFIKNKYHIICANNDHYVMVIGKQNSTYDKFMGINMCEEEFQYGEYLAVGLPLTDRYTIIARCDPLQSISIDSISEAKICYSILDYDSHGINFVGKQVSYEYYIHSKEIKQTSVPYVSDDLLSDDEFFIPMGDYKFYSPKKVYHIPDRKMYETDIGIIQCFNNHLYLLIND